MLNEVYEDLFNLNVDALAHGCNTKGIMDAGLAREFKDRYPKMFSEYFDYCKAGLFNPGDIHFYRSNRNQLQVINIATQITRSSGAKLEYIEKGFVNIIEAHKKLEIKSLGIPKIGCGLGGLQWSNVNKIVEKIFGSSDLEVIVALGKSI